jgi:hypothetical protein
VVVLASQLGAVGQPDRGLKRLGRLDAMLAVVAGLVARPAGAPVRVCQVLALALAEQRLDEAHGGLRGA